MRRGCCALLLFVVIAPGASADMSLSGGRLKFTGSDADELVSLRNLLSGAMVFVQVSANVAMTAPSGCSQSSPREIRCPRASIGVFEFQGLGGQDALSSGGTGGTAPVPVEAYGGAGFDGLEASDGTTNTLDGGADGDSLIGRSGNDTLLGGTGDDDLEPGLGTDSVSGGDGIDWLHYGIPPQGGFVTVTLGGTGGPSGENDAITTVENVTCSCADGAFLTGDDGPNNLFIQDTTAPVRLVGQGGNDHLRLVDTGDDPNPPARMEGGPGNDALFGGTSPDEFFGGEGNDFMVAGDDEFESPDPGDTLSCGAGTGDQIVYDDEIDTVDADCELPSVAISQGPLGVTKDTTATFDFDPVGTTVAGQFECRLDAQNFTSCARPKTYSNLQKGDHIFRVRFKETGGNWTQSVSRTWNIDIDGPAVFIDSGPSGNGNPPTATFAFHASESGATFRCSLDLGAAEDCSSPLELTGLADGQHDFAVTARDAAGNESPPATRTWMVEAGVAPAPTPSVPAAPLAVCNAPAVNQVAFGVVVAQAIGGPGSCFTPQIGGGFASSGDVRINGMALDLPPGGRLELEPGLEDGTLRTTSAAELKFGRVTLPVPPFTWTGVAAIQSGAARTFSILTGDDDDEDGEGDGTFLGLPVKVAPSFKLEGADSDGGSAAVALELELPKFIFHAVPGSSAPTGESGLTIEIGFTASNDNGVSFQGKASVDEAWLFGVTRLQDVELAIDGGEPEFEGSASFGLGWRPTLPLPADSAIKVSVALGPDGFLGPLRKLALEASGLAKPIGTTGFFVNRVGGSMQNSDNPRGLQLAASAGLSGGPPLDFAPIFTGRPVGLDGTLTLTLPSGPEPFTVELEGKGSLVEIPIAESTTTYTHGVGVDFAGKMDYTIGGYGLLMQARPTTWFSSSAFNVEASAQAVLPGFLAEFSGQGEALISSAGMAACFGGTSVRAGLTKRWGQPLQSWASGCDMGPLRVVRPPSPSAAQAGPHSVTVQRGTRLATIEIAGLVGPPKVKVSGPAGFSLETPAGPGGVDRPNALLFQDPLLGTTTILLRSPRAGRYSIAPSGTGPYASLGSIEAVRSAINLPPVRVSGRVRRGRFRWRLTPRRGQKVRFVEVGPVAARPFATTTRRRGSVRFSPDPTLGPGRHRIEAVVSQDGLPRTTVTLVRIRVKAHPTRPRGLRLRGRRLSWRRQSAAVAYAVVVTDAQGTTISRTVSKPRLRLPRSIGRGRIRVRVVALDAFAGPSRSLSRAFRVR